MQAVDLCDITDLVDGLARDMCRKWGFSLATSRTPAVRAADPFPVAEFSDKSAVAAIDAVLATYPDAVWRVTGDQGRIVAGNLPLSLKFSIIDRDAELCGWVDAAGRTPKGAHGQSRNK